MWQHAYCLNLDRRPDKWAEAQNQFARVGITVERWSAVDGQQIQELWASAQINKAAFKTAGALACLLSHIAIIQNATLRGFQRIAVFEDDVIFRKDFALPTDLPTWQLLYLGATQINWHGIEPQPQAGYYQARNTLGTWAMVIDRSLFARILQAYQRFITTADNTLAELQANSVALVCYPNLCVADVSDSDIRPSMMQAEFAKRCRWDMEQFQDWLGRITFGITSFDRPEHLARLVSSIQSRYPEANIVVADNGTAPAEQPGATILRLPTDAGASACRNALVDHCRTKYFLLLEDDFIFTDKTDLRHFYDVLEAEPKLGLIAGSLYSFGNKHDHAKRIITEGETLRLEDAASDWQVTAGTAWHSADMVFNFFLARREVFATNRWADSIKIGGEHFLWFQQLKAEGRWLVGHTPQVSAIHDMGERSDHYQAYRLRAGESVKQHLPNLVSPAVWRRLPDGDRPNVILLGVGHSGTTILAKILVELGWKINDNDERFYEDATARQSNHQILSGGKPDVLRYLKHLPQPWLIKDPRLVVTLSEWLPALCELPAPPLLVGITKDYDEIVESYRRRGESVERSHGGNSVAQLCKLYRKQFGLWPWPKVEIAYEQLAAACSLFTPRAIQ